MRLPSVAIIAGSLFSDINELAASGAGIRLIRTDPWLEKAAETPFGRAAMVPRIMELATGGSILYLNRHGNGHIFPAHKVPYRENVLALKRAGVRAVVCVYTCGTLKPEIRQGSVAVVTQIIDETRVRPRTFFDGIAMHVPFASPVCNHGTRQNVVCNAFSVASAGYEYWPFTPQIHGSATLAVIEGPRFSTAAESARIREKADLVGMTAMPELALLREANIVAVAIAAPTDSDVDSNGTDGVNAAEVSANAAKMRFKLAEVAINSAVALERSIYEFTCPCTAATHSALQTDPGRISEQYLAKIADLVADHPLLGQHPVVRRYVNEQETENEDGALAVSE